MSRVTAGASKSRRGLVGIFGFSALCCVQGTQAGGVPTTATQLDTVTVNANQLLGETDSATIGTVYSEQFQNRPLSRPGELLEVVPGLIVTQHSGEGKANQYFLRGFNLDHGTDFASFVDGMPVNMPTHAHGQGYSDNNFLLPELVDSLSYRKGPYYAQYGDFSAAGAVDIRLRDHFDQSLLQFTGGTYGYARGLAAGSYALLGGTLLYGLEIKHYDGAYDKNDNFNTGNAVLRYSRPIEDGALHLTLMGYNARFDSTDQIPQRAIDQGLIDRLGCFDGACSDGGKTHRYSLSLVVDRRLGDGALSVSAYAIRYKLDLYSDFTYYLDDPVRGDQFEQFDARNVYGGALAYKLPLQLFGLRLANEVGLQTRDDAIGRVGLYHTEARARLDAPVSQNQVNEWSQALYLQTSVQWSDWLRSVAGLRYDHYDFDVHSDPGASSGRSGRVAQGIAQPKLTLVAGPFEKTELFLNLGKGFHSNDARGATAAEADTPLVAARGADLGLRSAIVPHLQATLSLFALHIDSELTFGGDTGDTEPNRPSARYGSELALYWQPLPHLVVDSDYAYTHTRFRDRQPQGNRIPEAATSVFALGATYESPQGWIIAARLRSFGRRPLIEDDSVSSHATTTLNLDGGYRFGTHLKASLQLLNALNSRDHDIDYFFASRITPGSSGGEPAAGVEDLHFHPVEPINLRAVLSYSY